MNYSNYFIALLIGYNQTVSNCAPKIPTWIAVISLVIYHLERAGTFLFSAQEAASLGIRVNRVIAQIIKMFQIQYWTQITPLNYEGITTILFSIILLGVLVKLRFFALVRTRERPSDLFQLEFISWALVFEKYFLYIPVLENSFYVFSQPGVKSYILAFAIFNLACILISRALQSIFLFWNPYTNLKCISRGIAGEVIDIIGFVIMLATKNAGSNISVYIGLALTALQIICLFVAPKYVDGLQNQVELIFQAFCFALGIDILLQHHFYHTQDFPFLLITVFIYWGLKSLIRYRSWSLVSQFENPELSSAMVRSLPLIFDEFAGKSSLIESIYPILAYRSNLRNEIEDMATIFSKEDCSLEDDPHKQKTFQAFIKFIETTYQQYIQVTDITKPSLQPILVSYLFFVKRVRKDPQQALILLNDFRIKLKRGQLSLKLREKIQMNLIEEECLQEANILKDSSSLDVIKVFSVLDKTEDFKLRIINFIEKKLEFLDSLKVPYVDLNLLKSTGAALTQEIRSLITKATEDSDFSTYFKLKELLMYFAKEVLRDPKILGFEFKNTHSYRSAKGEGLKNITNNELIEKIQVSSTSQTFILVVNDCTINRGKIIRCTKQLLARLNYTSEEAAGFKFDDMVIAVNYPTRNAFFEEEKEAAQDSDQKMCQVILKNRNGDLFPAHGSVQHQIVDDIPCMILIGEEERSASDYFILCHLNGQIQGISAKLASSLMAYNKLNGKFIQQILSKRELEASSLLDEIYTRKTGLLTLQPTKTSSEHSFEVEFSVCPFGTKEMDSGICKNYAVYLYPASPGTLKDVLEISPRKQVSSTNRLMSQQSDPIPLETTPNSITEKNGNFQFMGGTRDDKTRVNTNLCLNKFGSQSTLKPPVYSSKILEVKDEEVSEHLGIDKSSDRKIEKVNDFVSEEFKDQESDRQPAWVNQNASTAYYGSMGGSARRQRNTTRAKQLINNHKLPVSIEWVRVLQLIACLTLFGYLIGDYLDLARKFEILSQMSGITSFPLTLMTVMAAFLNYSEIALAAAQGLFESSIKMQAMYLVPGMTQNFFTTFQTQFEKYVLQSNPSSYYSGFTYENYAMNLTLPDSPYLNREVEFNEALDVLRGYMGNFLFGILKGFQVNTNSLNFFRQENLNYNEIFQLLSDDLFSRLSAEFDNLLLLLALRVLVGVAVALTIGATVLYIFFKLHRSSENLLSKFTRISESELDNEIASLREKAAYLQERSEAVVTKKHEAHPNSKKISRAGVAISKKFKPLKQRRRLHIALSIASFILFLLPFLVAYDLKRSPVNSCIPLIKQYKLFAESGAVAATISAHFVEAMLMAASDNPAATLELLNATASYIDEAKEASSSLYSMLNTIDSLPDDSYVSANLTKVIQDLRNESFCDNISDSLISSFCKAFVSITTTVQFGVPAMFTSAIEGFSAHRKQLQNAPTYATAAIFTTTAATLHPMFFATLIHVALGDVITNYQLNFEEVAVRAQHVFQNLLAVSLAYYCVLILVTLTPLLPWARKEYKKVKEIYTLLPTEVLISNPYINMALKHRSF